MSRECCRCTRGPCRQCVCAQWGQSCTNCLSDGCRNDGWSISQYSPNRGQYEQRVKTISYKKNGFDWSTIQTTHTYRQAPILVPGLHQEKARVPMLTSSLPPLPPPPPYLPLTPYLTPPHPSPPQNQENRQAPASTFVVLPCVLAPILVTEMHQETANEDVFPSRPFPSPPSLPPPYSSPLRPHLLQNQGPIIRTEMRQAKANVNVFPSPRIHPISSRLPPHSQNEVYEITDSEDEFTLEVAAPHDRKAIVQEKEKALEYEITDSEDEFLFEAETPHDQKAIVQDKKKALVKKRPFEETLTSTEISASIETQGKKRKLDRFCRECGEFRKKQLVEGVCTICILRNQCERSQQLSQQRLYESGSNISTIVLKEMHQGKESDDMFPSPPPPPPPPSSHFCSTISSPPPENQARVRTTEKARKNRSLSSHPPQPLVSITVTEVHQAKAGVNVLPSPPPPPPPSPHLPPISENQENSQTSFNAGFISAILGGLLYVLAYSLVKVIGDW